MPPTPTPADREKTLKDIITAFGWRGRRGMYAEVGAHPNDFLLYAFNGSMQNVGVALQTALHGTTEPITLIGDAKRNAPLIAELEKGGIKAGLIDWRYGEPMPALPTAGRAIVCEIPLSYQDYTSLAGLRERYPTLSTLWELTLSISALLEVMLILDYFVGVADRNNKKTESLSDHEHYFRVMCGVYNSTIALQPSFPDIIKRLDLNGKTVIEFGPADGIHTGWLVNSGAKHVTTVEGRPENIIKLLAAQFAFGWKNLEIVLDNFQYPGRWADRRYDLVFAHGVVYHCLNPFYFMDVMTQITDKIFLGGWVATDTKPLSKWQSVEYAGRSYRMQTYDEPSHFCSGLASRSSFLDADGIENFFRDRGFRVELVEKDPNTTGLTDAFLRWIITRK